MKKNFTTISSYDSLILIESLGVNDNHTGLQLGYKLQEYCNNNNIVVSYMSVSNKQEFLSTLDAINNDILNGTDVILSGKAKFPLLHFDIHGNKKGLVLSNGDLIGWDVLADNSRNLNKSTKNNLLIILAVCMGFQSIVEISPALLTPYYALVGPVDEVYEKDIERLFPDFYLNLFENNNLPDAMKILKPEYHLYHCETVFVSSYARYISEKCKGEGKIKRLNELIKKYKNINPAAKDYSDIRNELDTLINPNKQSYNTFKNNFLLSNLIENKERFSVELDDIINLLREGKNT